MLLGLGKTLTFGQKMVWPYATGGDYVYLYEEGNKTYRVHEFLSTGTSTLNVEVGGQVEVLVVGGGGGGARHSTGGGGGGAGGVLLLDGSNSLAIKSGTYTVTVGTGGAGRSETPGNGDNGVNSSLVGESVSETAIGGGGGGGDGAASNGLSGGSGGGGNGGISAAGSGGSGTVGQGNDGGGGSFDSSVVNNRNGGGGGGASEAGDAATATSGGGGSGGDGVTVWSKAYGGGGGGGSRANGSSGGSGGLGGGGNGGGFYTNGVDGSANTGGGGGGNGGGADGGDGGSGIVIVRYVIAEKKLWTPSELTDGNLRQWYRADGEVYDATSGGNKATSDDTILRRWEDESGTLSLHPITTSESGSPVLKTNQLNGLPVVRFSGVRGFVRGATPVFTNNPSSMMFFAVFRDDNSTTTLKGIIDIDNYEPFLTSSSSPSYRPWVHIVNVLGVTDESSRYNTAFNSTRNSWQISSYALDFPNDSIFFQRNGGTSTYSATKDFNSNTYGSLNKSVIIGGRFAETTDGWIGDIAEIIALTNDVTVETRQKMEGYLAHKWGLTNNLPSGHPYKYEPPYKEEPEEIVTDGLVLNLDAGDYASYPRSGTTWYDITGNGYNGTLTSGPTYDSANKGSIVFNGVNGFVSIGNIGSFTSMSICTFMKRDGNQVGWAGLVYSRGTSANGLGYRSTTNQLGYTWNDSSVAYNWVSGLVPPDGEWIMAALCVSGSVATMYMCSSSGITSASNTSYTHTSATFDALRIGADYTNLTRNSKGNIATVHIYNRALSASEVEQNFNALRGRYGV